MSSIKYNPNPPRVWSRVQNRCSTDTADSTVDYARIDYERQMLLKGNILQYKKNSSNLTKNQRYTQIAKGMWTNRTKTWATQSDTYTNPNNSSLLRVNYTILDPSNNTFSSRSNPFNCPTTEIQDGGNLVCNVVVNPCTQEVIKRSVSQQLCNPTTDSDVPGQIQQLCWNDGTQTWYPRQRYTMGNSGTSWPEGYKGFVSAVTFIGPVLSVGTMTCGQLVIPLSWTFENSTCAPITSFNIYQNGVLNQTVPVSQTSITITGNPAGTYSFYVTSVSNTIESEKSNTVIVNTQYNFNINDTSVSSEAIITNNGKTITFTSNGTITFLCSNINTNITCVGGGGGGGGGGYGGNSATTSGAGGGGGGGEIIVTNFLSEVITYSVFVGGGAIGGIYGDAYRNGQDGGNGGSSYITGGITSITSIGGNGGKGALNGYKTGGNGGNGGNGGAGGNGGVQNTAGSIGNNGGGGGGGGYTDKSGGNGSTNSIFSGYGSGGGGGGSDTFGGGIGGTNAGNGSQSNSNGTNGISNKGGGGGGGKSGHLSNDSYSGGGGGSGVVIINLP